MTVYFAQYPDNGPIKIGFTTKSFAVKMAQLRHGCPFELKLLGAFDGYASEEHATHHKFRADRIRGEWFNPTPKLLAFIAKKNDPDEVAVFTSPTWPDVAEHLHLPVRAVSERIDLMGLVS